MRENVLKYFRRFLINRHEAADAGGYPCKARGFTNVAAWFSLAERVRSTPETILDNLYTRLIKESGYAKICIDAATDPNSYTLYYWYREAYNEVIDWIKKEKLKKGNAKWIGGM